MDYLDELIENWTLKVNALDFKERDNRIIARTINECKEDLKSAMRVMEAERELPWRKP